MKNENPPTTRIKFSPAQMLGAIGKFASREPVATVAAAFGVGLIINLLPAKAVVGTVTVLGATLMRPILLSLGATKAMELCLQKTSTHLNP